MWKKQAIKDSRLFFCKYPVLQTNNLPILRHINLPVINFLPFSRIRFLPRGNGLILRMPEKKMRDMSFLCQEGSVLYRTVVFFIGLKALTVIVETEGFREQPVGSV